MKIKEGYIMRNIAGTNVVVAVGKASAEFNGMIKLNDTGAFLFGKLSEDRDAKELVTMLLNEYDVTKEQAEKDVSEFTEKLIAANIAER